MANNNTYLAEIVDKMDFIWVDNCCGVDEGSGLPCPQFHFGYPSDVDEIHNKRLPLMVVNPPTSTSVADEYERNVVNTTTVFKLQIYNHMPSEYMERTTSWDIKKAVLWDGMENCFYKWLNELLKTLGSKLILGNGVVQITRRTQSSNDQMLQIECTFNLNYYRHCMSIDGDIVINTGHSG